jgi:hypothetical protein
MGKAAHSSIVTICMQSGVTHPSHKTKYKSITEVKLAWLKITVDQEQHHHTTNINTQEHHHHQDHITTTESPPHNQPCSCVEQQRIFTPQHIIK